VLALISADPYITTTQLANRLGVSQSAISQRIRLLKEKGVLQRIGADKGGYWEVIRPNK
jgi:ATP-dependent DNA helicase RecG